MKRHNLLKTTSRTLPSFGRAVGGEAKGTEAESGEEAVIVSVLLWFGVIGAVREWRYAKKLGTPIARREKWYLAAGVALAFAATLISDMSSLSGHLNVLFGTRATSGFWLAIVLIGWAARQMIRRARPRESPKTITTGQ